MFAYTIKPQKTLSAFVYCLLILIAVSCANKPEKNKVDVAIKIDLIKKQLGNTGYSISIPPNYSIKVTDGPDFSVYYFSPTDTTLTNKFNGGIYVGNYPTKLDAENDSCKTEILKSIFLNKVQEWEVYNCQNKYAIQTIIENENGDMWVQRLHAFGRTKNRADLQLILKIYSTLKRKEKVIK